MREFCIKAKGKIKEADYILLHHTQGKYLNAAKEMDNLLGLEHTALKSIRSRVGKMREVKILSQKNHNKY